MSINVWWSPIQEPSMWCWRGSDKSQSSCHWPPRPSTSPPPPWWLLSVGEMTAGNNSLPHYWHGFSSQHRPRYGTGADWVLFQVFNIQILEKNVCSLLTWDSSNLDNSPLFWAFLGQCSGQLFAQLVNINFSESHKNLMEIRKWGGIFDYRIKYCRRCFLNL